MRTLCRRTPLTVHRLDDNNEFLLVFDDGDFDRVGSVDSLPYGQTHSFIGRLTLS
jgi:hypothetical protein